ncbi:hypothetical protein [Methylobacterium sp. PvR107]|uniref:hypothetical protein n=1 Tax=Methylobacterium sp. PvR107 TaxID=2806597 RepID=UPI001AE1EFCE|nr:hypothetical protein [Methylobacterium sp. PvR107]MBP1181150.1 hypothetical protein [Methylobacterium sp. PvR107]
MPNHLIQILLPLSDNESRRFPRAAYAQVRSELTERFGGMTAFTRGPAEGLWEENGRTARDDIVVFEVMTSDLEAPWWDGYRRSLETRFRQERIIIRAQDIALL